jgi:hypothetical protein
MFSVSALKLTAEDCAAVGVTMRTVGSPASSRGKAKIQTPDVKPLRTSEAFILPLYSVDRFPDLTVARFVPTGVKC